MAKSQEEWAKVFETGYKNVTFRQIAEYLHDTKSNRFEYYKAEAEKGKHISTVRNEFYGEFFPDFKPQEKKRIGIKAFEFND